MHSTGVQAGPRARLGKIDMVKETHTPPPPSLVLNQSLIGRCRPTASQRTASPTPLWTTTRSFSFWQMSITRSASMPPRSNNGCSVRCVVMSMKREMGESGGRQVENTYHLVPSLAD